MSELEKRTLAIVSERCKQLGRTSSANVIQKRITTGGNAIQFEEWLSYLSNATYLLSNHGGPVTGLEWEGSPLPPASDLALLLTDLERSIYGLCSLVLPDAVTERTAHHALVAKLIARDAALGRSHLFTTNYDTLVEQALDDLSIQYMDGFVGTVQRRFDSSCYGLDIYYPGDTSEGRVRRYDKFLHLYKLHGSVNWRMHADARVVQSNYRSPEKFTEWRNQSADKQASRLDELFEGNREPMAILPTANKFVQTLGLPYAHLFRSLARRLGEPQTFFIVVGYGFGDAHLNQVIDDAMNNPNLVLLVVDPRPSSTIERRLSLYQNTGERAFLLSPENKSGPISQGSFDDFALHLLPQSQWLDDFTRVRRIEKILQPTIILPEPGVDDAPF